MESGHASGSSKHSSKDEDTTKKKDDALAPLISLVDSDHESGSDTDIEINFTRKSFGSAKKSNRSNSSSSSDSLAEDFFLTDASILKTSAHGDDQMPPKEDKHDILSDTSFKSEEPDVTRESLQSPPVQVMERPGGFDSFDPNRIPSSVFEAKPSTAMDWSVASNESLFSIHIGNNSFSKEQFLMICGDLHNSDELYKSGELYRSEELNKSNDKSGRPPLSPVGKLHHIKTSSVGNKSEETRVADESIKDSPKENFVDHVERKAPQLEGPTNLTHQNSPTVNRHSDGSGTSCQSFAFPILTDAGRSISKESSNQQDSHATESETNPRAKSKKASNSWWKCCSLPRCSCSSCSLCPKCTSCRCWC